MKRILLSVLSAAIIFLGSCDNENEMRLAENESQSVPMSFYASVESPQDSVKDTRSILSGATTDLTRYVLWEPADSIYVTNGTEGAKFSNQESGLSDVAEFAGSLSRADNYFAAFPYTMVKGYSSAAFQIVLPSSQPYRADNIASESFPMVAKCKDGVFDFRNLCGILVINLTGSAVIDSIRFAGTDAGGKPVKISGAASVSTAYTDVPILKMASTATEHVTLNCVGADGKGVSLKSTTPTAFHIVLPAETYSSFTLTVYSADRNTMTINGEKALTVKRSKRTTAASIEYLADKPVYEFVDLGLSVKWATFNVGATKPGEYGDYFAWGETEPKSDFSWENYKFRTSGDSYDNVKFSKYNTQSGWGTVDNKTVLDMTDDVARAKWGGDWRMPTIEEFQELLDNCTWTWTTQNGVNGYKVTGKKSGYTGRSIFLPAAGRYYNGTILESAGTLGRYWSRSLGTSYPNYADVLEFHSSHQHTITYDRSLGQSVRPVYDDAVKVTSVKLDKTELNLSVGETSTLTAIITPSNATNKSVTWTSSNTSVATVSSGGLVTAKAAGAATVTVTTADGGYKASCVVTVTSASSVPEMVDLGLSVKWATFNVGATSPEGYGDYYSWGETSIKSSYTWANYKFRTSGDSYDNVKFSKYNTQSGRGSVDNKTVLDMTDDVARVKWGGAWRMPTREEFEELLNNCTWTWTTLNGVNGYNVTSKKSGYTDRSIFLPAAGWRGGTSLSNAGEYGLYWSSSLYTNYPSLAWYLYSGSGNHYASGDYRIIGLSVRPVYDDAVKVTGVKLDKTELNLSVGETSTLTATLTPSNATNKSVTWTSSNTNVATVSSGGLVTAKAAGTATVTVTTVDGGYKASCVVTVTSASSVPEMVDLGLSVKWATFNVGATSPEGYGDYYSWGETSIKSSYTWENYKFRTSGDSYDNVKFSKYNTQSGRGSVDNKTVLDMTDDVARVKWGGAWRMPTREEFEELLNNCTWTWTTLNGVNGYKVTSKKSGYTDRSIFLPAAGWRSAASLRYAGDSGYYWSSSLYTDYPSLAWYLYFYSGYHVTYQYYRYGGLSVRPVCP